MNSFLALSGQEISLNVKYSQANDNIRITNSEGIKLFKGIEYELTANNNSSKFKLIEKMTSDIEKNNLRFANVIGGANDYYSFLLTKEKLTHVSFFGEEYLVKHPLNEFNWSITKDTKKIGKYLCVKATSIKKERLMYGKEIEYVITAWFTHEIPLPFGPLNYSGLPGLILEVNWRNHYLIANNISLRDSNKKVINRPVKVEEITSEEYEKKKKEIIKQAKKGN